MSFFFCGGRLDAIGEVRLFGDDARSDQLIAIVPGCELSRRDSALRFVEKQVGRVRTDEEFRSLQRLAITDTDIETTAFARFQFPERVDPVQLAGSDPQGPAVKSRMVVPLADVDHVLLHVGCQYEKRLLAAADPQPFALADGIKVSSVVLSDFLPSRTV